MKREDVLAILARESDSYARFGVKSLALFGLVARDEARSDSDVDILVEFEGVPNFAQYMDLKFLLEDALGRHLDLVERQTLHPLVRPNIKSEVIPVVP